MIFIFKLEDTRPIIAYSSLDLLCSRKTDTIRILNTSGVCNILENTWTGSGGRVDWSRYDQGDIIWVDLSEYSIDLKKGIYTADKVTFSHKEYFPGQKLDGSFEDKITVLKDKKEGSYPKFESYENNLEIKNIGGGASYRGGFKLHGTKVYGNGSDETPAIVKIVNKNGKKIFGATSDQFVIKLNNNVYSEKAASTIYYKEDSIYHPAALLRFNIEDKSMELKRGKSSSGKSPFYNSFHKVNISADRIDWLLDKDTILVGKSSKFLAQSKRDVLFESVDFFNENDLLRIQSISTNNPVIVLKLMSEEQGTRELNATHAAERINPKYTLSSIQTLLYDLVEKGFIKYDSDNRMITLKDKVFHYAEAGAEKRDYDHIRIKSETDATSGYFNLNTGEIEIDGVDNLELSIHQRVAIKPFKKKLFLKPNRDLFFDGKIFAGHTSLEGKEFLFEYDQNHVKMDSVRFFDVFSWDGSLDNDSIPIAFSISSRIEHLDGFLIIDAPENKSGLEDIPMFPMLESKGASYVFYDKKEIRNGVYPRDSFYFELDRFSFPNLDGYLKEEIIFKGTLFFC